MNIKNQDTQKRKSQAALQGNAKDARIDARGAYMQYCGELSIAIKIISSKCHRI